ncbi:hypothetical protein PG987_013863 [Apiospora arundinis]
MPHQRHDTSTFDIADYTAPPASYAPARDNNTPIIEVEGGQDGETQSFATLYARRLRNSTPIPPPRDPNGRQIGAGPDRARSSYLYHVILKVIQLQNWPQPVGSKQYMIGTYTMLGAANLAAGNALRRAGYDENPFTTYVKEPTEEQQGGFVVLAVTLDGVEFQIQLCRTPNAGLHLSAAGTAISCGTFPSYDTAKSQGYSLLLDGVDPANSRSGSSNSSSNGNQNYGIGAFVHYEEVDAAELDSSKGDCILVRAIGKDGTNYMISLAKGFNMEGMRWVEVARRD